MKVCKRCIISGRVQGVFYRQGTLEKAQEIGVKGWVRNLNTGQVEALICGEVEQVEMLCNWLHQGPSAAQVDKVDIEDHIWEEHAHFVILR